MQEVDEETCHADLASEDSDTDETQYSMHPKWLGKIFVAIAMVIVFCFLSTKVENDTALEDIQMKQTAVHTVTSENRDPLMVMTQFPTDAPTART